MSEAFKAVRVNDHVYWVGAVDWAVRDFHGYLTQRGSTYNAYLIVTDDNVTLIDTVKAPFLNEMLSRIKSVVPLDRVDTIISNHSEMDHSGALPAAIEAINPEMVYASKLGVKALNKHFGFEGEVLPVSDGETLDVGGLTLSFMETRMLHWPDSMFSYLVEDKLLFSQDAFGMHLATTERFADEIDHAVRYYEGAKYYANILLPLSSLVKKVLAKVTQMGLEIDVVCPDHGPIYRRPEDVGEIVGWYAKWAQQKPTNKAVVVYKTMWQSTKKMAGAIVEGIVAGGATAKLLEIGPSHRSDVVTELLEAGALVVGSSTLNNNMLPDMVDVMTYLKGLKPANLIGAAFGSYGWSGEAPKQLGAMLDEMKIQQVDDPLRCLYVPDSDDLDKCYQLGLKIAEQLKADTTE